MRKLLTKLIQLLDGTPAVYGERQSGQSVVELALITPILIVLLAGLVEIGWFANNYLTLLDVTRAGARRGAVLQDQKSPLFLDNTYSYVPNVELPVAYQMPHSAANGYDADRYLYRWRPDSTADPSGTGNLGIQPCDPQYVERVFYNEVICTMITTMEPLELNFENGVDDIVVSGFSVQLVDAAGHPEWIPGYDSTVPQMIVAGRYPTNANECNYAFDAGGSVVSIGNTREGRDPFDVNSDTAWTVSPFIELPGYDDAFAAPEKQIGFALFGNHRLDGHPCVGSEWRMADVEALMNLENFTPSTGANASTERLGLPSQGVIVVEIFWEHEMLLKIPLLSPVFTAVGNADGKMIIDIWAAFPLSSIEPHILFP